jgi:hypothetical protein
LETVKFLTQAQVVARIQSLADSRPHSDLADWLGIHKTVLSHILAGRRSPGLTALKRLGLKRVIMYEEKGR